MNTLHLKTLAVLLGCAALGFAQDATREPKSIAQVTAELQAKVDAGLAELAALRESIAAEKLPLTRQLAELESTLSGIRGEFQQRTRVLDGRTLDLSNLRNEIKSRQEEVAYIGNLVGEYARNFESRLHIAELQRYRAELDTAKLAAENTGLDEAEVLSTQAALLTTAFDRLDDALGGVRFEGTAVAGAGVVAKGTFAMVGPVALFRAADGHAVGTAEQRLGSLEPAVIAFGHPEDATAAAEIVQAGVGSMPIDPTLGNAHKIEATEDTLWEHIQKGGPVMVPIFAMAGAALLIALFKWLQLMFVRVPSRRQLKALLESVGEGDRDSAEQRARAMSGPVGRMLAAGVANLGETRDYIEEVMYESVLTARLRLMRFLPFIAICAASAPLLGLLGTVTGIINTFKQITVFGSGDVKSLSGGISEALITTEFGLIVAIPSLLLHAFLSRKARGVIGEMESSAVALVNRISKAEERGGDGGVAVHTTPADPQLVRAQIREVLGDLLGPLVGDGNGRAAQPLSSGRAG